MKPVTTIVTVFLLLVSSMHLLRLIFQVEVIAAGAVIPVWISFFGFVFTAALAVLLWQETRDQK